MNVEKNSRNLNSIQELFISKKENILVYNVTTTRVIQSWAWIYMKKGRTRTQSFLVICAHSSQKSQKGWKNIEKESICEKIFF